MCDWDEQRDCDSGPPSPPSGTFGLPLSPAKPLVEAWHPQGVSADVAARADAQIEQILQTARAHAGMKMRNIPLVINSVGSRLGVVAQRLVAINQIVRINRRRAEAGLPPCSQDEYAAAQASPGWEMPMLTQALRAHAVPAKRKATEAMGAVEALLSLASEDKKTPAPPNSSETPTSPSKKRKPDLTIPLAPCPRELTLESTGVEQKHGADTLPLAVWAAIDTARKVSTGDEGGKAAKEDNLAPTPRQISVEM